MLVVDDQQEIHDDFREMLQVRGGDSDLSPDLTAAFLGAAEERSFLPRFELLHASSGEQACTLIGAERERGRPIAVAYIDVRMPPGIDGVEAVRRIRKIDRDLEIVIMTAYAEEPLSAIVQNMELLHKLLYIRKPFAREEVQQITSSLVMKWNLERELAERRRALTVSHQHLDAVLDAAGDAIAMYDAGARLVFANRRYQKLVARTQEELRRMSPAAVADHCRARFRVPRLPHPERPPVGGGEDSLVEHVTMEEGSAGRLFVRSKRPVRDPAGAVIGELVVYRDVSQGPRDRAPAVGARAQKLTPRRAVREFAMIANSRIRELANFSVEFTNFSSVREFA